MSTFFPSRRASTPAEPFSRDTLNQGGEKVEETLPEPQTKQTSLSASSLLGLQPLSVSLRSPLFCALIRRFHVKSGAVNFGRVAAESLRPPYFHTQGGLQKYVGGATRYVRSVRGLVKCARE